MHSLSIGSLASGKQASKPMKSLGPITIPRLSKPGNISFLLGIIAGCITRYSLLVAARAMVYPCDGTWYYYRVLATYGNGCMLVCWYGLD